MMDAHTLRVLEFDRVLETAASLAETDVGAEMVAELEPIDRPERLETELDRVAETVQFIQIEGPLDLDGLVDLEPYLNRVEVTGGFLDPAELDLIRRCLACLTRTRRRLTAKGADYPLLASMAGGLDSYDQLLARFKRTFGPGLTIADSASPNLKRIRRRQAGLKTTIRAELETIIDQGRSAGLWQDELITQRSGRFVVPVRASRQGRVQGIIHDSSASHQTVYMEPLAVTGLNNQLGLMSAEERAEVEAILRELTDAIRPLSPQLLAQIRLAGRIDCLQARARLARRLKAVRPEMDPNGRLELKQARHPLLVLSGTVGGPVIPVDLSFPADKAVLIISGPNAGGKTVSLKCLGLLSLMALSGMFIPAAEGSRLPLLAGVAASIGDDQAISEGESTFSARLKWLAGVLDTAGDNWLVLIDELGGGTDPAEGAALGLAALDWMAHRGVRAVATTHLNHIKAWAAANPAALNLSVLFDPASRRPTFELVYGRPGLSNAFEMAERVGLDPAVTDRARGFLGGRDEEFKDVLEDLTRLADEHHRGLNEVEELRADLANRARRLTRRETAVEDDRRRLMDTERVRLEKIIDRAEGDLKRIVAAAGSGRSKDRDRAKYSFYDEKSRLKKALTPKTRPRESEGGALKAGQAVWVEGFPQPGVLLGEAGPGGRAEVRLAGGMKVKVAVTKLSEDKGGPQPGNGGRGAVTMSTGRGQADTGRVRPGPGASVWPEVKIIGLRVDEALDVVDRALDRAVLSGTDRLSIIHGVGTGALRQAVRRHLVDHPQVNAFDSPQGTRGAAVTEVELR